MDKHDLVLAILDSNRGTVGNRTSLQKLGYFASTRTALDGVGYKDYFYGPFSKGVAIALEDLSEALLLYESVRSSPIETYSYTLTDDGREIVKEVRERCREECGVIGEIVSVCRDRCNLEPHPLACAAKSHYLMVRCEGGEDFTRAEMAEAARGFGWNLSDEEIGRGVDLVDALCLPRGRACDRHAKALA